MQGRIITSFALPALFAASVFILPLHAQNLAAAFHNLPLCTSTGTQSAPQVIPDQAHGVWVLWEDNRSARTMLYCQRLDSLGHPKLQNNGLALATTSGRQTSFAATSDGSGGFIVVWQEVTNDDGDIFAQRFAANGQRLWGVNGKEVYRGSKEQSAPQVIVDSKGGAYVFWHDQRTGSQDLIGQRLNENGDRLWNATGVELVNTRRVQTLGEAVLIPERGFALAWQDENPSPAQVLVQLFDQNGKAQWSAPIVVAQSSGEQSAPRLLLDESNANSFTLFVAWLDRRFTVPNVFAQKLDAAGALLWGGDGVVAGRAASEQKELQLLRDGASGVFLVWEDARNDKGDIFAQRLDAAGKTLWPAQGLALAQAEQGQFRPRLTSDGQAGFIAAWEDERSAGTNIHAQRVNALGQTLWSSEGLVLTNHGKKNSQPAVLAISTQRAWSAWMDERNGSVDIFAQALDLAGKLDNVPPRFLSQPEPQAFTGAIYSYTISAVDYDSDDAPRFELPRAPAWLQLNHATGTLAGTPSTSDTGEALIELHAVDGEGGRATQSFALKVSLDTSLPQILSLPDTLTREDERYVYQIKAADPDPQETLRYSLESNAAWLRLSLQGELAGTPLNEHVGNHAVTITVANSKNKMTQQQFTLRVENTNDAPLFTSKPDTVVFVDSIYVYKALVQDVDNGDRVTLTVLSAPTWLTWDAANQTLRGAPKFTDVDTTQISLRAEDLSKAAAVQNVSVRVVDLAAPDNTAPAAPQSLTITPPRWSSAAQFTVQWQNPFDQNKIAGAYFKIGATPSNERDGTLVRSSANEPVREISLQAPNEGVAPVYVWLMDSRNNVDHRTASRVEYRYDRTTPQAPSNLRVLTSNGSAWVASDTLTFVWQAATDALSGLASYSFILNEKAVGQTSGNATSFTFIIALKEGAHTCQVTAIDSAGNRRSSARANFRVDHTPPILQHAARDTITLGQTLTLRAQASDVASGIAQVRVRYRNAGELQFGERAMTFAGGEFVTDIASEELRSSGFAYMISANDSAGNRAFSTRAVHTAVIKAEQIAAPNATRGEYYQLVSPPYFIKPDSTLAWLQDDLGVYDETAWRLYSYHPGRGNVEFGREGFWNFTPGRALWLITSEPKNFEVNAAHSISTAQDFVLELQPGWNLIATPFDFPTDWSAVQKPALVEPQLWAFDGKQYVRNDNVMQPWQGYFVRNLNATPEKIFIPPRVAQASLPAADLLSPSLFITKRANEHAANDPSHWRMQLRVTNGAFADHENWLGVSASAKEEWDELEWSEPPLAPGNFVTLRFNQTSWQRFNGAFATDIRPPSANAQSWRFEIFTASEGQRVELVLARRGFIAPEKLFVLVDEENRLAREITFDERTNLSNTISWRSTKTPQRFALHGGTQAQLDEQNVTALLAPKQFDLAPAYPNPASAQVGQEAMSAFRFSLPQASAVELRIYDLLGRQVRALALKQFYAQGHHEIIWDGKDDRGHAVAAGVYLYRMLAPSFQATRKLVVMKE